MEVEVKALVALMFTPITYRGYNYDIYTGLYYLQSRYYNPSYGRFLNADTTEIIERTKGTVLGANIFAYCNNNPVMNVDYEGEDPNDEAYAKGIRGILIALVIALAVFLGYSIYDIYDDGTPDYSQYNS